MTQTGFLDGTAQVGGLALPYQVYVPRAYAAGERWPVILFLHGAGERGDDGHLQTTVGLGPALRRDPARYPALVVLPQAPRGAAWQGATTAAAMLALRQTLDAFDTDPERVYLTGISMGGNGVWNVLHDDADAFAAAVPICGWVTRPARARGERGRTGTHLGDLAQRIGALPLWIFHGAADTVVPVGGSREIVAALEARGADVRYTELDGVGHNSWDPAYALPELSAWLFAQRQ